MLNFTSYIREVGMYLPFSSPYPLIPYTYCICVYKSCVVTCAEPPTDDSLCTPEHTQHLTISFFLGEQKQMAFE